MDGVVAMKDRHRKRKSRFAYRVTTTLRLALTLRSASWIGLILPLPRLGRLSMHPGSIYER